jgi:hypothetical protein
MGRKVNGKVLRNMDMVREKVTEYVSERQTRLLKYVKEDKYIAKAMMEERYWVSRGGKKEKRVY